jgi:hypothetical protein
LEIKKKNHTFCTQQLGKKTVMPSTWKGQHKPVKMREKSSDYMSTLEQNKENKQAHATAGKWY